MSSTDTTRALSALQAIPADCDRDSWQKTLMAAHAAGLSLDDAIAWSESAPSFNLQDLRNVWRSIKPGAITEGTLFYLARQNGWKDDGKHHRPSAEDLAQRQRECKEQAERQAAEKAQRQDAVSSAAQRIWDAAKPAESHPYLTKKGIKPHGTRIADDTLLIPIFDVHGKLWNLQKIAKDGDKLFMPGGKVSGCFCTIGEVSDAVVIVEGFATGATVHEVTGRAVIVAFNADNLPKVAQALMEKYPDMAIIIGSDDDHQNQHNPGQAKAKQAAVAVEGAVAIPSGFPADRGDKDSDFNDLHRLSGADAVLACFADSALVQHAAPSEETILATPGTPIKAPLKTASALSAINPECDEPTREKIGKALHSLSGGGATGFVLWRDWCKKSTIYRETQCRRQWAAFADTTGKEDICKIAAESFGWEWSSTTKSDQFDAAMAIVEATIAAVKTDATAYLKPSSIEAFKVVQDVDDLEHEAARTRLKEANPRVRVGALDKFVALLGIAEDGFAGGQNDATTLVNLASERCQLWHDKEKNAYATMQRTDSEGRSHFEHWAIESKGFRDWLAWVAHTEMGSALSNETLSAARNALQGKAKFDGEEHQPFKRVAKDENGYWIDICDDQWRAILVTASGWKIVDKPGVRFTREPAMRPLPIPLAGGNVNLLWNLVNIPEEERQLVLAWILEAYRCDTPYAVLELIGEQGSAKSSTQRNLRQLIDPNRVALRGKPKTVEDVYVSAQSNHLVSLENLSGITADVSDALCTIATGGGTASRTLYTNGEESIIEVHNPVVLNGIGAVITRNDLLDRAIALCLPTIQSRRTEDEVNAQFEQCAPSIFGGLLDLFSGALVNLVNVKANSSDLPRMADFAKLGEAMSIAQGFAPGTWLKMYKNHRKDAISRTIDSSPVAVQCMDFVSAGRSYSGTVKGLLDALTDRMNSKNLEHGEYWPRSPKGLADSLRRAAPALRQLGILVSVDAKPKKDGVHCQLTKAPHQPGEHGNAGDTHTSQTQNNRNQSSPCSPSSPNQGQNHHETDDVEVFEL